MRTASVCKAQTVVVKKLFNYALWCVDLARCDCNIDILYTKAVKSKNIVQTVNMFFVCMLSFRDLHKLCGCACINHPFML